MPRPSNRDLLLDVAERLFARDGVDAVSLRAVNAAAGLNAGSVNYYFGSKDALVEAILLRRMEAVMGRRGELLDALDARATPPATSEVIEAIVLPLAELVSREGEQGRCYVRFLARLFADRSPTLWRIAFAHFQRGVEQIDALLIAANPHLPVAVLRWRRNLAIQTALQALPLDPTADVDAGPRGHGHAALDLLVDFVSAGLSAPLEG